MVRSKVRGGTFGLIAEAPTRRQEPERNLLRALTASPGLTQSPASKSKLVTGDAVMSRGNERPDAKPKDIRLHNVAVFQRIKNKLVEGTLQSEPAKWVTVAHTFLVTIRDARIYYDEARSDVSTEQYKS